MGLTGWERGVYHGKKRDRHFCIKNISTKHNYACLDTFNSSDSTGLIALPLRDESKLQASHRMEIGANRGKKETLKTMEIANEYCEANDGVNEYEYLEIEVYDWQAYGTGPVSVETGGNGKRAREECGAMTLLDPVRNLLPLRLSTDHPTDRLLASSFTF